MNTPSALIALCASVMFLGACGKTTPAPPKPVINPSVPNLSGGTSGAVANPGVPSAGSVFPPSNGGSGDPAQSKTDGTRKPAQESDTLPMPGQNNDHSAPLSPAK